MFGKILLAASLIVFNSSDLRASIMPEHVTCNVQGEVLKTYSQDHVDRAMGEHQNVSTSNIDLHITDSAISHAGMEGACPEIDSEDSFSLRDDPLNSYQKGDCIRGTSKKSGSTTFNANWIYDIQKLSVEDCQR